MENRQALIEEIAILKSRVTQLENEFSAIRRLMGGVVAGNAEIPVDDTLNPVPLPSGEKANAETENT